MEQKKRGPGRPRKEENVEPPTEEEILETKNEEDTLRKQNEELLEKLTKLQAKSNKQEEALDPKKGPGELCQAWHVSMGEALQDGPDERGVYAPLQDGYVDGSDATKYPKRRRYDSNRRYIIYPDTTDEEFVPNCESRYTKEYERNIRLKDKVYESFEWDKAKVLLCKKHADILLGINEE